MSKITTLQYSPTVDGDILEDSGCGYDPNAYTRDTTSTTSGVSYNMEGEATWHIRRAFWDFTSISIPNRAKVVGVRLILEITSASANTVQFRALGDLSTNYTDANLFSAIITGNALVQSTPSAVGEVTINLGGVAQSILNRQKTWFSIGAHFISSPDTPARWATQEHATAAYRPILEIDYAYVDNVQAPGGNA